MIKMTNVLHVSLFFFLQKNKIAAKKNKKLDQSSFAVLCLPLIHPALLHDLSLILHLTLPYTQRCNVHDEMPNFWIQPQRPLPVPHTTNSIRTQSKGSLSFES